MRALTRLTSLIRPHRYSPPTCAPVGHSVHLAVVDPFARGVGGAAPRPHHHLLGTKTKNLVEDSKQDKTRLLELLRAAKKKLFGEDCLILNLHFFKIPPKEAKTLEEEGGGVEPSESKCKPTSLSSS